MKIIPKMQSGGGMPPFIVYDPLILPDYSGLSSVTTSTSTSSKTSGDSTKGLITDKDLLEMVGKIDGLPSDLLGVHNTLLRFYLIKNIFNDGIADTSSLAVTYLKALRLLQVAKFNKSEYDEARKLAISTGGLNEAAITDTGKLVVLDKNGDLKTITSDLYLNNSNDYLLLTNSNLLYLRALSPEFAYSNGILGVVSNSIGISSVNKLINDAIETLGTTLFTNQGYSYKDKLLIKSGIALLQEAAEQGVNVADLLSIEGLYKNKILTKDLVQLAYAAVNYIYNTLPSNAKTLLELRSNNKDNPKAGALNLVSLLIMSRTSSTFEFDPTFLKGLDENGNEISSKTGSKIKTNPLLLMIKGFGGEQTTISVNPRSDHRMTVRGTNFGILDLSTSKGITKTTLQDMLTNSGISNILSLKTAVTFGDLVISPDDFDKIVYSGSGATRAILPIKDEVDETGKLTGRKIVNLDIIDDYEKALAEVEQLPDNLDDLARSKEVAKILKRHNLDDLIDSTTGLPNPLKFAVFLLVDGKASDKDDLLKRFDYMENLGSSLEEIDDMNYYLGSKDRKDLPYELDYDSSWIPNFLDAFDTVYAGTIYIPLTTNENLAIIAYGDLIPLNTALDIEIPYQSQQQYIEDYLKIRSMKSTGSGNL